VSGTSMATPMVAGAVALMMAGNRRNGITQTPRQIRDRLRVDASVMLQTFPQFFPENTSPLALNVSQL